MTFGIPYARRISETFDLCEVQGVEDLVLHVVVEVDGGYSRPTLDDPGDDPEATITSILVVDEDGKGYDVPELIWKLVLRPGDERLLLDRCIEQAIENACEGDDR